jgi:hypothetical protein
MFLVSAFLILAAARWATRGFPMPKERATRAAVAVIVAYAAFQFLRPLSASGSPVMVGVGGTLFAVTVIATQLAMPLLALYVLIRFVKWAWTRPEMPPKATAPSPACNRDAAALFVA